MSFRIPPFVAALAGGLLVAMSLPPWGWWPLAFAGIAIYVTAHGRVVGRRAQFAAGFAFGLAWLAVGTAWMWQLTVPGYLVASVVFGCFHGVAAIAAPGGRWREVGLPVTHTLVEAVRFSFPFGGVPLASLGIAQVAGPARPDRPRRRRDRPHLGHLPTRGGARRRRACRPFATWRRPANLEASRRAHRGRRGDHRRRLSRPVGQRHRRDPAGRRSAGRR